MRMLALRSFCMLSRPYTAICLDCMSSSMTGVSSSIGEAMLIPAAVKERFVLSGGSAAIFVSSGKVATRWPSFVCLSLLFCHLCGG